MFGLKKRSRFRISQTVTLNEAALKGVGERLSTGLKKALIGRKFMVIKIIPSTIFRLKTIKIGSYILCRVKVPTTSFFLCLVDPTLKEGTRVECWLDKWFEETE